MFNVGSPHERNGNRLPIRSASAVSTCSAVSLNGLSSLIGGWPKNSVKPVVIVLRKVHCVVACMICCHSHHNRSQFEWKNQKIGSKAATSGTTILWPHATWPLSCPPISIPFVKFCHWNSAVAFWIFWGI